MQNLRLTWTVLQQGTLREVKKGKAHLEVFRISASFCFISAVCELGPAMFSTVTYYGTDAKHIPTQMATRPRKRQRRSKKKTPAIIRAARFTSGKTLSRGQATSITSQYHAFQAEADSIATDQRLPAAARQAKLNELKGQVEAMGGHEAYQQASALNTNKFRTSKYVFSTLTKLGLRPKKNEPPLKTLEIGAINLQLLSCFWLATRAIDLVSRFPGKIEALNFFELPLPTSEVERYAVVVCFMVLNYVSHPLKRGELLVRAVLQLRMKGHLFLALPLRCFQSARGMKRSRFLALTTNLGLSLRGSRDTPKIAFFCFQKVQNGARFSSDVSTWPEHNLTAQTAGPEHNVVASGSAGSGSDFDILVRDEWCGIGSSGGGDRRKEGMKGSAGPSIFGKQDQCKGSKRMRWLRSSFSRAIFGKWWEAFE
eukprot:g58587.t1